MEEQERRQLLLDVRERLQAYIEAVAYVDATYVAFQSIRSRSQYSGPQVLTSETEDLIRRIDAELSDA